MEHLKQSFTAGLKKAQEDRMTAETDIYCSQNPLAKSILNTERASLSTSSNPDISVIRSCHQSSLSQTVCLNSRKDSDYISKYLGIMIFFIHVFKIVSF